MKQSNEIFKILNKLFNKIKPHGTVGEVKSINGKCPGYYIIPGDCVQELLQLKESLGRHEEVEADSPFSIGNIPSKILPYYHNDPIVRTVVDSFRATPNLKYETTEKLLETICLALLKVKDDYFKQIIDHNDKCPIGF